MSRAMQLFHERHPDVVLQVNVTRHPYSFVGDRSQQPQKQGELDGIGTSAEKLRTFGDQMKGRFPEASPKPGQSADDARRERMEPFLQLGRSAGIDFDLEVVAQYQPVESQRLLLWAARQGRQEPYMSALNRYHFEERRSASLRETVLAAAEEAGLDIAEATAFLETDELEDEVWRSYGDTIARSGIRAIPLFAFSVPSLDAVGGPFRPAGEYEAYVVRGSSNAEDFLELFELVLRDERAGARVYDEAAFPFRRDEWWAKSRA